MFFSPFLIFFNIHCWCVQKGVLHNNDFYTGEVEHVEFDAAFFGQFFKGEMLSVFNEGNHLGY